MPVRVLFTQLNSLTINEAILSGVSYYFTVVRPNLSPYPFRIVPYRTVPYRTVPYRTVPYRTVPYRTVPYRTVSYRIVPYRTVLYRIVPYRIVPYRTVFRFPLYRKFFKIVYRTVLFSAFIAKTANRTVRKGKYFPFFTKSAINIVRGK